MKESLATYIYTLISEIAALPATLILLATLLVMVVMVLDSLSSHIAKKNKDIGLHPKSTLVSVDGAASLPIKTYVSDIQKLAGTPDAIIREDGFIIPIERKPLARKIRDRYVAQLLVYMRLVEEFEGKKPPYGYLILGPSCRRVKIQNTEERQKWLQGLLDQMHGILAGQEPIASPHPRKCQKCEVREHCNFRAENAVPSSKSKSQLLAKRVIH